jgi:hypothetical protein
MIKSKVKDKTVQGLIRFLKQVDKELEKKIFQMTIDHEKTHLFHYYYGKQAIVNDLIGMLEIDTLPMNKFR